VSDEFLVFFSVSLRFFDMILHPSYKNLFFFQNEREVLF
jgi:hypothetical protein